MCKGVKRYEILYDKLNNLDKIINPLIKKYNYISNDIINDNDNNININFKNNINKINIKNKLEQFNKIIDNEFLRLNKSEFLYDDLLLLIIKYIKTKSKKIYNIITLDNNIINNEITFNLQNNYNNIISNNITLNTNTFIKYVKNDLNKKKYIDLNIHEKIILKYIYLLYFVFINNINIFKKE